jgi:hypothetical protein
MPPSRQTMLVDRRLEKRGSILYAKDNQLPEMVGPLDAEGLAQAHCAAGKWALFSDFIHQLCSRAAGPKRDWCRFLSEASGVVSPSEAMASWAEQLERELSGRGLAVAFVPGKGRGLVATRSFFPGTSTIHPPQPTLLFAPCRPREGRAPTTRSTKCPTALVGLCCDDTQPLS